MTHIGTTPINIPSTILHFKTNNKSTNYSIPNYTYYNYCIC